MHNNVHQQLCKIVLGTTWSHCSCFPALCLCPSWSQSSENPSSPSMVTPSPMFISTRACDTVTLLLIDWRNIVWSWSLPILKDQCEWLVTHIHTLGTAWVTIVQLYYLSTVFDNVWGGDWVCYQMEAFSLILNNLQHIHVVSVTNLELGQTISIWTLISWLRWLAGI